MPLQTTLVDLRCGRLDLARRPPLLNPLSPGAPERLRVAQHRSPRPLFLGCRGVPGPRLVGEGAGRPLRAVRITVEPAILSARQLLGPSHKFPPALMVLHMGRHEERLGRHWLQTKCSL